MASKGELFSSSIVISHIGGKYFVWDANHALQLRTKHRICGIPVGSTPRKPWQPSMHSIPLLLSKAEAYYCYKNGIANIFDSSSYFSKRKITDESTHKFEDERSKIEKEQIQIFKKCKTEKKKLYYGMHKNVTKLNRKRVEAMQVEPKFDVEAGSCSSEVLSESGTKDDNLDRVEGKELHENITSNQSEKDSENEIDFSQNGIDGSLGSTILSEKDIKYYSPSLRVHISTNSLEENLLVPHVMNNPVSDQEKCCFAVYSDIHKKGFFVTSALKFGGDFLVYPGDPLRYHSHYIMVVLERNQSLSMKETITYGRLAASVKKTVVLATVNEDYSSVSYLSLTWPHMK